MADSEYAEIFREEAGELLEELETSLLELEKDPSDLKIVSRVFRAMHTIKGSGAMFGFDDISGFTHHVETALDKVRDGTVPVSTELINLTLASRDHIRALLDAATCGGEADPAEGERIIGLLQALVGGGAPGKEQPASVSAPPALDMGGAVEKDPTVGSMTHYRITIKPTPEFFVGGNTLEQLLDELKMLGECTVFLHEEGKSEILLTTDKGVNGVEDVLVFAESSCEVKLKVLAVEGEDEFEEHRKLGEILVEKGEVSATDLGKVLERQKPLGELLIEERLVSRTSIDAALAEQKMVKEGKGKGGVAKGAESIRVASEKLDQLINLVGELVVTQARLTQVSSHHKDSDLVEPVEEVERLTAELRDCVLNIRMLPIGTTFTKFKRLVRDLSAELGKEVVMVTEGAETELDKNVIDQLGDPMVHLIRNSIDHGIESPEERELAGKPRKGTISLAAQHSGANVVITVTDDGKGLDAERIRQKGLEKGLIRPDMELSEQEIWNTIFTPGLSTAKTVTSVSGRGVGMDVVKSTVDALKGSVSVTSSVKGKGTTITIMLPLTLAIIDGLLTKVGDTHFVLPLSQVEECVELTGEDIAKFHQRRMLPVRDQLVPYVRLRDFFAIPGERPALEQMVISRINGERFGLVLDGVVGEHQTVLKSLGWVYRNATGLSGSTILGNGHVALILDVANVMKCARQEEHDALAN
ncbi:MAG: chemotaxis protein CheA [Desulfobulbaceae bacterium]|nr:chemotaxis protein CheA [Desulfobulbaceae bacterium]HIJ91308.1 chemotaxis protein CheA [Deltaproteobacteria bacterium]